MSNLERLKDIKTTPKTWAHWPWSKPAMTPEEASEVVRITQGAGIRLGGRQHHFDHVMTALRKHPGSLLSINHSPCQDCEWDNRTDARDSLQLFHSLCMDISDDIGSTTDQPRIMLLDAEWSSKPNMPARWQLRDLPGRETRELTACGLLDDYYHIAQDVLECQVVLYNYEQKYPTSTGLIRSASPVDDIQKSDMSSVSQYRGPQSAENAKRLDATMMQDAYTSKAAEPRDIMAWICFGCRFIDLPEWKKHFTMDAQAQAGDYRKQGYDIAHNKRIAVPALWPQPFDPRIVGDGFIDGFEAFCEGMVE